MDKLPVIIAKIADNRYVVIGDKGLRVYPSPASAFEGLEKLTGVSLSAANETGYTVNENDYLDDQSLEG